MLQVGVVGPADRDEMVRLTMRLEERGAQPVLLDSRQDPRFEFSPSGEFGWDRDLSGLRAAYIADLGLISSLVRGEEGNLDWTASKDRNRASVRHYCAWLAVLNRWQQRMTVVNPPACYDLHSLKPWEMAVYARAGLPVPFTLATTDPTALQSEDWTRYAGWIRKGMIGGLAHTEFFTPPASADEAQAGLANGPLMVQERIGGDNVRAFFLDGKCLGAAEIVSRSGTETDSRRGDQRVRRIDLPQQALADGLHAARHWGMIFSAVDYMRDESTGRYVILECNSAPFFVNFSRYSGLDIAGPLAAFLDKAARAGVCEP